MTGRFRTRLWAAAGAAGVAASIVLVGCGSSPPVPSSCPLFVPPIASPSTGVTSSLEAVSSAALADLSGEVSVRGTFSAASLFGATCAPMVGSGVFDDSTAEGSLDLQPPGGGGAGTSSSYTVLYTPAAVYVRLPTSQTRLLPAGRNWIQALFAPANSNGTEYPEDTQVFFGQALAPDPRLVLEELALGAAAAGSPVPVGTGPGRALRYDVEVNLATVKRSLSGAYAGPFGDVLAAVLPSTTAPTTTTTSPLNERVAYLSTTSTTANIWLTTPKPQLTDTTAMQVVLSAGGALRSVTFDPSSSKLGAVTLSFSAPPSGTASPDHLAVPGANDLVDVRWLLRGLGGETSSDVS